MKKIIVAAFIVGTLLFLWSLSADAAQKGDYWDVERGDSLTKISSQVYGTIDKWTIIRDLNDLEKPYTIRIGQMLRVNDLTQWAKKDIAFEISWEYMERHFKARRGNTFNRDMDRNEAYEELKALTMDPDLLPTHEVKNVLNRTATKLEWVDLLEIAEAIESNVDVYWHVLVMTALGAQESGFRNVPGSHEELGPYQIKPNTALWLLAKDVPIRNADEASSVLELPSNNTWMSYRILQKCGLTDSAKSLVPALERYNAGKDKVKYARQVEKRYKRLLEKYREAVAEALKQPSLSPAP